MEAVKRGNRPRIVIVGGGFGGAFAVQRLASRLRSDEAEVLLIDRNNYFVFHPFLVEAGTGSLHPQHAVVGLRAFTGARGLLMGEFIGADLSSRLLKVQPMGSAEEREIPFDELVLALGSVTSRPPIPGLKEHALQVKSVADAIALRDRAIRLLEQADQCGDKDLRRSLLHFVVVGSSFTGVEIAGEFEVFLRRASRRFDQRGSGRHFRHAGRSRGPHPAQFGPRIGGVRCGQTKSPGEWICDLELPCARLPPFTSIWTTVPGWPPKR